MELNRTGYLVHNKKTNKYIVYENNRRGVYLLNLNKINTVEKYNDFTRTFLKIYPDEKAAMKAINSNCWEIEKRDDYEILPVTITYNIGESINENV